MEYVEDVSALSAPARRSEVTAYSHHQDTCVGTSAQLPEPITLGLFAVLELAMLHADNQRVCGSQIALLDTRYICAEQWGNDEACTRK